MYPATEQSQELKSGSDLSGRAIWAFVLAAYGVTWLACLSLRSAVAAGKLWAFFTFLFITVWSPTVIALVLSFGFNGAPAVRELLGLLFRPLSKNNLWYVIAVITPIGAVGAGLLVVRHLHSQAPFIPLAALPLTLTLQLFTGATGEEMGWRGFLLPRLENRFSPRVAAILMGTAWAGWHLPAFYFPGMPQQQMPPAAFLLMVAAFGVFLALLFERTGSLTCTMLAHFTFNTCLAIGGAVLGPAFLWTLAVIFSVVAIWSLSKISPNVSRRSTA